MNVYKWRLNQWGNNIELIRYNIIPVEILNTNIFEEIMVPLAINAFRTDDIFILYYS